MRILNIRRLVEQIFREEPTLPSRVDRVQFVSRRHSTVYRVWAGEARYIVHATPQTGEDLGRIRNNLRVLESLTDERIPRLLAFRDSGLDVPIDQRWAMLVMSNLPGEELGPSTFSRLAWANLCDLLKRVHSLPGYRSDERDAGVRIDDATGFSDFAATLQLHLAELPLRAERVRAHLDVMNDYVNTHAASFVIPLRMIHGDINRENIRIDGQHAGLIDWSDLGPGDYAYDLATLKFALDSVVPRASSTLIRELAREYRRRFDDDALELRLRFFLALPGLVSAFWYTNESALFPAARAWRVRTCYLHSETQWKAPLCLDGTSNDAPIIRTEHWALRIPQPARGLFYLLAPKRLA